MRLMGLVDDDAAISESLECPDTSPVSEKDIELLFAHEYYEQYRKRGRCDGHYTKDQLKKCTTGTYCSQVGNTLCEQEVEDIKALIRSPQIIQTTDEGNEFILALLRLLLHLTHIRVVEAQWCILCLGT